jgi:hypothetical protein
VKPIRRGDTVKTIWGEKGRVDDIKWIAGLRTYEVVFGHDRMNAYHDDEITRI